MLHCHFNSISLPKLGNSVEENEDNILEPSQSEFESCSIIRFAISDGATESSFSKEWSDILVSTYKDNSFEKKQLHETIKTASENWLSNVNTVELPWYAQQKAEKGAFASFLGLTIDCEKESFDTIAVGDCTLFLYRNNTLHLSFPVSSIEDFHNTPNLIASNPRYQTDLDNNVIYHNEEILFGDILILSTDAMAAWILEQTNLGNKVWKSLIKLIRTKDKNHFENWLNKLRKGNKIKNDDIALLIIEFE